MLNLLNFFITMCVGVVLWEYFVKPLIKRARK